MASRKRLLSKCSSTIYSYSIKLNWLPHCFSLASGVYLGVNYSENGASSFSEGNNEVVKEE